MLIKGPCEVHIQKLFVVDSKPHDGTSEAEVVKVVRVDVGHAVRLEGASCTHIHTQTHATHSYISYATHTLVTCILLYMNMCYRTHINTCTHITTQFIGRCFQDVRICEYMHTHPLTHARTHTRTHPPPHTHTISRLYE